MKRSLTPMIIVAVMSCCMSLAAQPLTQTVRGTVVEKDTRQSLPGVNIVIQADGKTFGASTDVNGRFTLAGIPVGRHILRATMIGMTPFTVNNLLVNSGKETAVEIEMEEQMTQLDGIVVTPRTNKDLPLNKMAAASARMLSAEEADRYAGSFGDPARMVAGFAGVSAASDARNDIVIRGNSSAGLLWRLDGFNIPNPNHFGSAGNTGGPVSMLNNNQLSNSDFLTGAFPAEYGNATSGVFDLRMRNGNSAKHEFLAAAGYNGLEAGAEGPLGKSGGASYLVNARYSFLQFIAAGMAMPKYMDASGKINIPLRNGNFSLITLAGAGNITINPKMDEGEWKAGDFGRKNTMENRQYFIGANYTRRFGTDTRLENRLSLQTFSSKYHINLLTYPDQASSDFYDSRTEESILAFAPVLYHRFNSRNLLQAGAGVDVYLSDFKDISLVETPPRTYADLNKTTALVKSYVQWQHRFTDALSIMPGIYTHYYTFSSDISAEPRLGMKWALSPRSSLNFGVGLHSLLQARAAYFYENENGELPNKNLRFSKSLHSVAGYDCKLSDNLRLKLEAYHQYLYEVPVTPELPAQSILNLVDGSNYNRFIYTFVNNGTGSNYGVELTIERFFTDGYYFLLTGSLYNSTYKGYDGQERNTLFNGNYALNALGGYEWKIFRKHLLSVNMKLACTGNKRILPASAASAGQTPVYDYAHAYEDRLPGYFRADLNIAMKQNFRRFALEWFFELENVTDHKNVFSQTWNVNRNAYETSYQRPRQPMLGVKVFF